MCNSPIRAWKNKEGQMVFNKNESFSPVEYELPCGQCMACRIEKGRVWAVRIMGEQLTSDLNGVYSCFLTLTYEDDKLPMLYLEDTPYRPTLRKRDVQLFFKRLRNRLRKQKIRYYFSGEYSPKDRPHYHVALFGTDFPDKTYHCKSKGGYSVYVSKLLQECWPHGYAYIGALTFESAAYVASYIQKKVTGQQTQWLKDRGYETAEEYYDGREVESACMSRKPGIGAEFCERYASDLYPSGNITIRDGVTTKVPRYYRDRLNRQEERRLLDPTIVGVRNRKKARLLLKTRIEEIEATNKSYQRTNKRKSNSVERKIVNERILQIKNKLYQEFKNENASFFDI